MTKATEKKERPRYETPVVVTLDQLDKANGAGELCVTGSAVLSCTTGANATQSCGNGGAGVAP